MGKELKGVVLMLHPNEKKCEKCKRVYVEFVAKNAERKTCPYCKLIREKMIKKSIEKNHEALNKMED